MQEGGLAVAYETDYGDYIADNWQVYGDKIFFEGAESGSVTDQAVLSMNLDGSGLEMIISDALDNGQRITVYKGKIYANTYGTGGRGTSIVSFNLDGTGRKVLYTGDLSVLSSDVGYANRGYFIFNDRIYYMPRNIKLWNEPDKKIYSMNLDGSDQKLVASPSNSPLRIISVYDGYIYYETSWAGLHRVRIDGTGEMCVLPEKAEQYAIYGDKIVYDIDYSMLGVVNTDGTGRYQFPNAKQDPDRTANAYVSNLMVLNSRYTFAQNVIYNNDSAVPGHIEFGYEYFEDNERCWQRGWTPIAEPSVNTLTDITLPVAAVEKLSDGWYNLRCMNNYLYLDAGGGAQLRTTNTNQKFKVENKSGNYFTLKTEGGKYLGVTGTVKNGVQVKAVDEEYLWALRSENGSDIFSLRPANNGEMILNAAGEKNTDGTWIILWKYDKEDAPNHAEFRFIPVK